MPVNEDRNNTSVEELTPTMLHQVTRDENGVIVKCSKTFCSASPNYVTELILENDGASLRLSILNMFNNNPVVQSSILFDKEGAFRLSEAVNLYAIACNAHETSPKAK